MASMHPSSRRPAASALALAAWLMAGPSAAQDGKPVYRCPGPPVLYTDALSAAEAKEKGCRVIEGSPVTVIPAPRPRAQSPAPAGSASSRPGEGRVDPAEQRARDTDARRILTEELRKEEDRLAQLRKDYNGGEPERKGDERNYQKYLERVAEMKAAIARKEADIAALKRELAKLPQ